MKKNIFILLFSIISCLTLYSNELVLPKEMRKLEKEYCIPYTIKESDINKWLEKMTASEARSVKHVYNKLGGKYWGVDFYDNDELLKDYPFIINETVFMLNTNSQLYLIEKCETIFKKYGYTIDDYKKDIKLYTGKDYRCKIYDINNWDTVKLKKKQYQGKFVRCYSEYRGLTVDNKVFLRDGSSTGDAYNNSLVDEVLSLNIGQSYYFTGLVMINKFNTPYLHIIKIE